MLPLTAPALQPGLVAFEPLHLAMPSVVTLQIESHFALAVLFLEVAVRVVAVVVLGWPMLHPYHSLALVGAVLVPVLGLAA